MAVDFELHPREPKAEQCWIFIAGELVEKCATADKVERLAAHGLVLKRRGGYQSSAVRTDGR